MHFVVHVRALSEKLEAVNTVISLLTSALPPAVTFTVAAPIELALTLGFLQAIIIVVVVITVVFKAIGIAGQRFCFVRTWRLPLALPVWYFAWRCSSAPKRLKRRVSVLFKPRKSLVRLRRIVSVFKSILLGLK